jgi:FkbM family methyltransferase
MLFNAAEIGAYIKSLGIAIMGVLHVGAHDCEELAVYREWGIKDTNVYWIDALPDKVQQAKQRAIPNVFQACITDKDGEEVKFNVANNGQSSSVLSFGTHSTQHPEIHFTGELTLQTSRLDTFATTNNFPKTLNFWNFDIQGAELMALSGGVEFLKSCDVLYTEVNVDEVYVGCARMKDLDRFLAEQGFSRVKTRILQFGWGDALYIRTNLLPKKTN